MMVAIYNLLNTALSRQSATDVVFSSKKEAEAFRFKVYSARSRAKKAAAIYEGAAPMTVSHPYDMLTISVVRKSDDRWAVRLEQPQDKLFHVEDASSGEEVEVKPVAITIQPAVDENFSFDDIV